MLVFPQSGGRLADITIPHHVSHSSGLAASLELARFSAQIASVLLLSMCLFAQEPKGFESDMNAMSADSPGNKTVIRTKVRQVIVDVVVTDAQNRAIKRLTREDFTVFEDKTPQKILSFEAHNVSIRPPLLDARLLANLTPNTFVNTPPGNENLPLTVLLYDTLNTPAEDQPYAHAQILRFLQNRPVACPLAIFVLSDKLHLLQGFTDDERLLAAAINGKEAGTFSSGGNPSVSGLPDVSNLAAHTGAFRNDSALQGIVRRMEVAESVEQDYFLNQRIGLTLSAFGQIAGFLNGLPGRKNLIWLSGSFPTPIFSGKNPRNPFGTGVNYSEDLRKTADLLNVGQVAVYPVDARGLPTDPAYGGVGMGQRGGDSPSLFSEHVIMNEIASDTGGQAFYFTNGLAQAIATATEDGTNYYTLSYAPTNTNFNGHLRNIRIKASQPNYHLAYRHSYLADDDKILSQKVARAPEERLRTAAIAVRHCLTRWCLRPRLIPKDNHRESRQN